MDPNKLLDAQRREDARRREATREEDRLARIARQTGADREPEPDAGHLRMERRQGQWRYYLDDRRVRVGDELEVYLDDKIGWVRASFQWGRRNTSPATLRIRMTHPTTGEFVGEGELAIPDEAVVRYPDDAVDAAT